jgi:hypothetical protein
MQVTRVNENAFKVSLEGPPPTTHLVSLTDDYYQKLTRGRFSPEALITLSFEFLLERESNTSILRSFDLPMIGRYFPDFETDIVQRLG